MYLKVINHLFLMLNHIEYKSISDHHMCDVSQMRLLSSHLCSLSSLWRSGDGVQGTHGNFHYWF